MAWEAWSQCGIGVRLLLACLLLESTAQPLPVRGGRGGSSGDGGWTSHTELHSCTPGHGYVHGRGRLHGDGEGGNTIQVKLSPLASGLIVVVVVTSLLAKKYADWRSCRAQAREQSFELRSQLLDDPLSHEEYAAQEPSTAEAADAPPPPPPSGLWRGYYTLEGKRHDVCEFNLSFSNDPGRVMGSGVDDVGPQGNQGHTVEYRGQFGASLGEGVRGTWHIRSEFSCHDGQFHLWPAMEGWSDSAAAGASESGAAGQVFEESECVICYDRAISTRLRPCGHVALCEVCATSLSPRRCPLCRSAIATITSRTPSRGMPGEP